VEAAKSAEDVSTLVMLIRFHGSLLIFRLPELTRAFLAKAGALGGEEFVASVQASLMVGAGPSIRGFTDGVLDQEYDYVEAEAVKAAEANASDPILGPFYRSIVEWEQRNRLWHKSRSEAAMAAME
jgi:hypothetical protein